jgi:protein TonB
MSATTSLPLELFPCAGHRGLVIGAAVSAVLHALVLLLFPGFPMQPPVASSLPALTATFTPRSTEPEPVSPTPARATRPPAAASSKPAIKAAAESAPPAEPFPDTVAERAPEIPSAEPAAAEVVPFAERELALAPARTELAPAAARTERAAAQPPAIGAAPAPGAALSVEPPAPLASMPSQASEFDPRTLDQYRLALIIQARRHKHYPAQAMERGWAGKVEVRLVVTADGSIGDTRVTSSSGYSLLDDQALDMVRKAKPSTRIPPALRGRQFSVDIPIIFDLRTG